MKKLLGASLRFDWKTSTAIILSTLILVFDHYRNVVTDGIWNGMVLYFAIPVLVILIAYREPLSVYGLTLGDWKAGLIITTIAIALIAPFLWWAVRDDNMTSYYQNQLSKLPWGIFLSLFSWEFFFRGWLTFSFTRRFGPEGLWLQAVPFALAHIGKPEVETLSTIFGGFVFGWIAYRTRSFIYPLLIHWFVASFTILVAAGALG